MLYVPNFISEYTIENGACWRNVLINHLQQYPIRKSAGGYRIIVVGDPGVGKRTLLSQFRSVSSTKSDEFDFIGKTNIGNFTFYCSRQPEVPTDEF